MTTPTAISPFLAQLIDEIAQREGFVDYTVSSSSGSSLGDGFQGVMLRVTINGKRSGEPGQQLALICKMPPADQARQELCNSAEVFEREIYVYEKVLPMLVKFQRDLGIADDQGFFRFPKCYGTASNPATCDYALVMADLKSDGYEMWNRFEALDFEHATLAVAELGKLHAVSFAMRDQRPDLLAQLRDLRADTLLKMSEREISKPFWRMNYEMAVSTLNADEIELSAKIGSLTETFVERLRFTLMTEAAEPYAVLSHGDFWNNNMMYKVKEEEEGSKRPGEVCFIDWQMTQFCSPAIDLMVFLFSSTEHQLRRDHFWDLIQVYYDSLAITVRALGSDPERLFRYDDLRAQLKQFGQYAMVLAPMFVQVVTAPPEDLPDFDELARQAQSDSIEGFEGFVKKDNPAYRTRMSEVIRDYFAFGFDI